MLDLAIRGGTIIDGTGAPATTGDIGVENGQIVSVGGSAGPARRDVSAAGALVTPGWVDIHTHYDGQVTWDPWLTPSTWHGVTSVVMGNCGVGFAPVRPDKRDWLIATMEGVEDIPGAALHEGIQWEWESFPQYLDALAKKPLALDIAAQVPHAAMRGYVMGERGIHNEPATDDDIATMSALTCEGLKAGALGFSTSRTLIHKSSDGELVAGTFASEAELMGFGKALRDAGHGLFQMTSNHHTWDKEFPWMRRLAATYGVRVAFNLVQVDFAPAMWRRSLALMEEARREGIDIVGSIAGRPAGMLLSWDSSTHPFTWSKAWRNVAQLAPDERLARLRQPDVKAALIAEEPETDEPIAISMYSSFHKIFPLGSSPDYEPAPERSVAAQAKREGRSVRAVCYDLMMEQDGRGVLYYPVFNYTDEKLDHLRELMLRTDTVLSLGDGGAHCGVICDASLPTFMLTHWTRDRTRGDKLPLEFMVKRQTADTADTYGLRDRGRLKPGYRADINIIDYSHLTLHAPEMVWDLPANGHRFVQRADGYIATIVAGTPIFERGEKTGALPGKLVRGMRMGPG